MTTEYLTYKQKREIFEQTKEVYQQAKEMMRAEERAADDNKEPVKEFKIGDIFCIGISGTRNMYLLYEVVKITPKLIYLYRVIHDRTPIWTEPGCGCYGYFRCTRSPNTIPPSPDNMCIQRWKKSKVTMGMKRDSFIEEIWAD